MMIKQEISLFAPSSKGQENDLKLLLDQGYDPNEQDSIKQTPLLVAIINGHLPVVKMLLEKGANPNLANIHGQTPLFLAASDGRLDLVSELLAFGAEPNLATRYGNTPLYIASISGHYSITDLLLQHEEACYTPDNPFFIILQRLNSHIRTLAKQSLSYHESIPQEEARHDKIEFLILLIDILKPITSTKEANNSLKAVFNLEKRFQDKIFLSDSYTRQLFELTVRCIYTGNTFSFESMLM